VSLSAGLDSAISCSPRYRRITFSLLVVFFLTACGSSGKSVTETVAAEPSEEANGAGIEHAELVAEDDGSLILDDGGSEPDVSSLPAWLESWKKPPPQIDSGREYRLGQIGPAGGIIFYDKESYSDGWRYLEAAPPSMEFTAEWSTQRVNVDGTEDDIGSGKYNTMLITNELSRVEETETYAAKRCQDLVINGYTDWFLPSLQELDMMYEHLKQKDEEEDTGRENVGGFAEDFYWSSSEIEFWGQRFGMAIDFSQGNQSTRGKPLRLRVRAVRAF
jgi:hypothetical protein